MNIRILGNKSESQEVQAVDLANVKPGAIESSILEGTSNEEEYEDDFGFDDR